MIILEKFLDHFKTDSCEEYIVTHKSGSLQIHLSGNVQKKSKFQDIIQAGVRVVKALNLFFDIRWG